VGDVGDDWRAAKAAAKARRMSEEPGRMDHARTLLTNLGCAVGDGADGASLHVTHGGKVWRFWPYKGFWSGPGGPGRGIQGLAATVRGVRKIVQAAGGAS